MPTDTPVTTRAQQGSGALKDGEQELNLDQTIELFEGIKANFLPKNVKSDLSPAFEAASFDVS